MTGDVSDERPTGIILTGGRMATGVVRTGDTVRKPSTDASRFVVAHSHYTVFRTVVFAMFAGFYFWWPKITGRMLDERLGQIHFWTLFVGFHGRSSSSTGSASTACRAGKPTI